MVCDFLLNSFADTVQMVAWPLEFLGLTLILFEVRWPDKANDLEDLIDAFAYNEEFRSTVSGTITIFLGFIFFLVYSIWLVSWAYDVPLVFSRISHNLAGMFFTVIIVLIFGLLVIFVSVSSFIPIVAGVLSKILGRLDRLAQGRALGALGVILSLFAFSCESYQFAHLLSGCP